MIYNLLCNSHKHAGSRNAHTPEGQISAQAMLAVGGEWLSAGEAMALLVVLGLATVGTLTLFLVGLAAYRRRGTRVYLLLLVALGLLVSRSIVGFGTAMGAVPMPIHHLVEHSSDFAIAALVLYALYRSGPVEAAV
jgi:hypothetical protein